MNRKLQTAVVDSAHMRCRVKQEALHPALLQGLVLLVDELLQQLAVELSDAGVHAAALLAQDSHFRNQAALLLQQRLQALQLLLLPLQLCPQRSHLRLVGGRDLRVQAQRSG